MLLFLQLNVNLCIVYRMRMTACFRTTDARDDFFNFEARYEIGRTDYARVEIDGGLVRPLAISGASMLSSVTRADGFVVVLAGLEGYAEGTEIEVHLYDSWSAA